MISSIILLKTALDALPLLAMVFFSFSFCYQFCLLDFATMSMTTPDLSRTLSNAGSKGCKVFSPC